jgi:ABC-type glycerol-3-phosphate transport system permease component
MDGARPKQEVIHLLTPLALPGIASTALLAIILAWNEAFWTDTLSLGHRIGHSGSKSAIRCALDTQEGRSALKQKVAASGAEILPAHLHLPLVTALANASHRASRCDTSVTARFG